MSALCTVCSPSNAKNPMQQRAASSLRVPASRSYPWVPGWRQMKLSTAALRKRIAVVTAAGPSTPNWGSLFDVTPDVDETRGTLSKDGATSSAITNKPTTARKQLNRLFDILSAEKHIIAKQNFRCCQACADRAIDDYANAEDIGYCLFHEQDAEKLAINGSVSLAFSSLTGDYDLSVRVAKTIYETALACDLHVQWNGKLHHRIMITGFDPEEFIEWKDATGGVFDKDRQSNKNFSIERDTLCHSDVPGPMLGA